MLAVDIVVHAVTELKLAPAPKARSSVQRLSYSQHGASTGGSASTGALMLSFDIFFGKGAMDTAHYNCPYSTKCGAVSKGGVTSIIEGRQSCEYALSSLRSGSLELGVQLRSRSLACTYKGRTTLELSLAPASEGKGDSLGEVAVARSPGIRLRLDAPGDESCWVDCSVGVYDLEKLRIPSAAAVNISHEEEGEEENAVGNNNSGMSGVAEDKLAIGDLSLSDASQGSLQEMLLAVEALALHRGGEQVDDEEEISGSALSLDGILLECEEARMRHLFGPARSHAASRRTLRYGGARAKSAARATDADAEALRHTPQLSRVARTHLPSRHQQQQQRVPAAEGAETGLPAPPVHHPEVRPLVYFHR